MSKVRRIRIDVYGQFRADVIRRRGRWTAYRLGDDGKRSLLKELAVAADASPDEVVDAFEMCFRQLAGADAELRVLDILMA